MFSRLLNLLWWWPETQSRSQIPRLKEAQEKLMKFTSRHAENTQVGCGVHRTKSHLHLRPYICRTFWKICAKSQKELVWPNFDSSLWLSGIQTHELVVTGLPKTLPHCALPNYLRKALLPGSWPKPLGKRWKQCGEAGPTIQCPSRGLLGHPLCSTLPTTL